MQLKACKRCGESKPIFDFPLCRGVPRARCKPCHVEDARQWAAKNPAKARANKDAWHYQNCPPKMKHGPPLPPEIYAERRRESRERWKLANPEADAAAKKKWADANKHVSMEVVRRRQAKKLQATPKWADHKAMQAFYKQARELTLAGTPHEVDHIVPLQGVNVCGLHVPANLQVLPRTANRSKANKL
jgi:hypothetical protein